MNKKLINKVTAMLYKGCNAQYLQYRKIFRKLGTPPMNPTLGDLTALPRAHRCQA